MPLIRRQSRISDKIPTSSMADIAFLLLIFFLTSTVFDEERGLRVTLPEKGPQAAQEVPPENLLFFLVRADGGVAVRRGEGTGARPVSAGQVEEITREALAANPALITVIQTSPRAPYEAMIDVLDAIQSAGATQFSLQALGEE